MGGSKTRTILLDSSEDVVDVVGEEPFSVEHSLDQAGNCSQRHIFGMRVSVPLEWSGCQCVITRRRMWSYLETLFNLLDEHVAVCRETVHGQDCTIGSVETRRVRIDDEGDVEGDPRHTA